MQCNWCGKKATIEAPDPYYEEMPELLEDGETNEVVWWCDDCFEMRADEV